MAVKIRLRRMGAKKAPFYRVVVADSRYPRDGRFIEEIGTYDILKKPSEFNVDAEAVKKWIANGAQPTDTTRNILSREGVCLMKHLLEGVKKGAFDEATAQAKLQAWKEQKLASLEAVKNKDAEAAKAIKAARLEAEKEVNKVKAEALAQKKAKKAAAEAAKQAEAAAEEAAPAESAE